MHPRRTWLRASPCRLVAEIPGVGGGCHSGLGTPPITHRRAALSPLMNFSFNQNFWSSENSGVPAIQVRVLNCASCFLTCARRFLTCARTSLQRLAVGQH